MKERWIDTRLNQEEMNILSDCIAQSHENPISYNSSLVGNISKSELLKDKDNWFYKTALKELTERMFYEDWDNYYECVIRRQQQQNKEKVEFELNNFWVNYQKQYEFNPLHDHSGLYSFVIFVKIPTHWEEQYALPFCVHSKSAHASDFMFVWSEKNSEDVMTYNYSLSPEDEGRMLFFPATLKHMVYPFYETKEERITVSGNIKWKNPDKTMNDYENMKNMIETMENSVESLKKQLKYTKKP